MQADATSGQIDTVSYSAQQNPEFFWYAGAAVIVATGLVFAFHHLKPSFKLPKFPRRPS